MGVVSVQSARKIIISRWNHISQISKPNAIKGFVAKLQDNLAKKTTATEENNKKQ